MLNIVVALKFWATQWSCKKVRIKCDNMTVVEVLTSGRTKDSVLALCAHNIWLILAIFNISIHIEHIPGKNASWHSLHQYVPNFMWIKWSKTLQARDKITRIHIPVLPDSRLCPVAALKRMLAMVPGSQDDPLFSICRQGSWVPLTDCIVRKHLTHIIRMLGWEHKHITFLTLRRSGASWAFQHGVPIKAIKSQGTWKSDCVWRYIHTTTHTHSDPLLQAFRLHLPH